MKQETNKEMDLLLRRLARRGSTAVPDNNGKFVPERHLDADELSAYAEHALPAAARSRYTEHLADCARCREIVVGLSASLGQPVLEKTKTPEKESAVKRFLAALFAPAFARYAIPTLALIGIVGIGLIVFRQGAADRMASTSTKPVAVQGQVAQANQSETSKGFVGDSSTRQTEHKPNGEVVANYDSVTKSATPEKAGKQTEATAPAEAAPPPVSEPKPAKLAAADEDARRREAEVDQKRPATVERQQQPADEVERGRDKENAKKDDRASEDRAATTSRAAKAPAKTTNVNKNEAPQNASGAATTGPVGGFRAATEEKRKDAVEMRTVAGRRFHREGNAWVDTAYEPGRATTSLSRGSEQYRALIADEPEIRTIADTLSGEVVVIWKGRAYRIR